MPKDKKEVPWLKPFQQWLKELSKEDPEAAMRPNQHEKAFAAGWNAAKNAAKKSKDRN